MTECSAAPIKTEHTKEHKLIAQHKLDRETGREQREREQSIMTAKDELLLSSLICDESKHEAGHIWSSTMAH
jgi:hypothetical protein